MSIINVTAFCSNKTCCPTISIDTETAEVTIVDDFKGKLIANREIFLRANFFARKLSEDRLTVTGSAVFRELEYTIEIINREEVYYLSLEYKEQKVKEITLEQWNILADAVYASCNPWTVPMWEAGMITDEELDEELVNA